MGFSKQDPKSEEIQAASVIHAAETVIGSAVDVSNYNTICVYVDYSKGDETSVDVIPKYLRAVGDDEHQDCSWSAAAGTRTVTADKYRLTASGKHFIMLDVRCHNFIKLYEDATGGTPSGTLQVGYTIVE